ncbi:MAG: hypothetical protein PF436_07380 [Prolixibacteraceae bacterium]|jgi:hypothetical protein|nr:hypothetical protein [Prolixibacteraceae bacterium]
MKIKPKLLVVFILFISSAQAQLNDIVKCYSIYQSVYHNEKIFVQTDRPAYVADEEMWFSAFITDVLSQKLNTTERVMYVELVTPFGQTCHKQLCKIEDGRGHGNFTIDSDLQPGNYHLVAYTNWMRNMGCGFYFTKPIRIIQAHETTTAGATVDTTANISTTPVESIDTTPVPENLSVRFFPEGGDLIEGIACKVAFEVTGKDGKSAIANGFIVDSKDQVIAPANTMWKGKGMFTLTPEAGHDYFLQVNGADNERQRFELPAAKQSGLAMTVADMPGKQDFKIVVSKKGNLPADSTAFLLATQNQRPQKAMVLKLKDGQPVSIQFSKQDFKTGIVQFTLFNSDKEPQAERLFFVKNPDMLSLSVAEETLPTEPRGQVIMVLEATDQQGNPVTGDFALSVTDAARIPDGFYRSPNIFQYLSLHSDLPFENSHETVLFENTGEGNYKSELLMLTNGWRRYAWEKVLADTMAIPRYLEEPGIYVEGKVRTANKRAKIPADAEVSMVTKGSRMEIFSEKVGTNGAFTFLLRDFEDTLRTVVQTKNRMASKKDYALELHTNYQKRPTDNYRFLQNHGDDVEATTGSKAVPAKIETGELEKVLSGRMVEDTFMVTTDFAIEEVAVEGKRTGSYKEEITKNYGSPDYSIGQKRIKELVEEKPWQYGLISILSDAFPDLRIETSQTTLTYDRLSMLRGGEFLMKSNIVASDSSCISFQLINKRKHRFFVFVDGQMVAASNAYGYIYNVFGKYTIDDLISLNPSLVSSLDLIYPKNNNARAALNSEAEIHEYQLGSNSGSNMQIILRDLSLESDKLTTPVAVLSIYTKDGAGLLSTDHYKGIANITLHGYARTKEFYSPDYSTNVTDSVLYDFRNTLVWFPNLKTDSTGKAVISFFASDVSNSFRVEVNGLSADGTAGGVIHNVPGPLFETVPAEDLKAASSENTAGEAFSGPVALLPDSSAAAFAMVKNTTSGQTTFTSLSGRFSVDEKHAGDDTKLEISKPGYQTITISLGDFNNNGIVLEQKHSTPSEKAVDEVMKDFYRSKYKNRHSKPWFIEGAFREQLYNGHDLHQLSDFYFIQRWQPLDETNPYIETHLYNGRVFRSHNFSTKIGFKPQNRFNGAVPVMDPQFADLTFLNRAFAKNYEYTLEGENDYQGRKMYHISFDQADDAEWALYSGEIYIDAETGGLAWARWKISAKGEKYLMPDEYLAAGGDAETFKRLNEHNEISYGFNGEFWIPQFAVSTVSFEQRKTTSTYVREMALSPTSANFPKFKNLMPEDMNRKARLVRNSTYNPSAWRHAWLLPPVNKIEKQIRFLNHVVEHTQ